MKAPAPDGCDNRVPQSPTTAAGGRYCFHSTPPTTTTTEPPHRTPLTHTHSHTHALTHTHRSFTFFARRQSGLGDRSRFTHPEASVSLARERAPPQPKSKPPRECWHPNRPGHTRTENTPKPPEPKQDETSSLCAGYGATRTGYTSHRSPRTEIAGFCCPVPCARRHPARKSLSFERPPHRAPPNARHRTPPPAHYKGDRYPTDCQVEWGAYSPTTARDGSSVKPAGRTRRPT